MRVFILDPTLTPAIETFGADEVRLLDPRRRSRAGEDPPIPV